MHQPIRKTLLERPTHAETNLRGWESVAAGWKSVSWPRRPSWREFQKLEPLPPSLAGQETLVMGATPEFRAWLHRTGARISLYEKSDLSLVAMSRVLADQFGITKPNETVIPEDWEYPDYERKRYRLIMGDLVAGYLETKERFLGFLLKLNRMLVDNGILILREFVRLPYKERIPSEGGPDLRRWAYILKPGFAIEGHTFYEEKLTMNLVRVGDREVLSTCADPPRTRLMLAPEEFTAAFTNAGFEERVVVPPIYSKGPAPALWMLRKAHDL